MDADTNATNDEKNESSEYEERGREGDGDSDAYDGAAEIDATTATTAAAADMEWGANGDVDEVDVPVSKRGFLFRGVLCRGKFVIVPCDVLPVNYESQRPEDIIYDELHAIVEYANQHARAEDCSAMSAPIDARLSGYPDEALRKNMHHHVVLVTATVAHVLRRAPWLITRAADAYYCRQPQHIAHVQHGERTHLLNSSEDTLVRYRTRFTRCSYAQLVLQEAVDLGERYPARPEPTEEDGAHGDGGAYASNSDTGSGRSHPKPTARLNDHPAFYRKRRTRSHSCPYMLGLKVTVGLELLACGHGKYEDNGKFADTHIEATHSSQKFAEDWRQYMQALLAQNYFSSVIGSEMWYADVDRAKDAYMQVVVQPSSSADSVQTLLRGGDGTTDAQELLTAPGYVVRSLATDVCCHHEYPAGVIRSGTRGDIDIDSENDDDTWMEMSEAAFEREIEERERQLQQCAKASPDTTSREDYGIDDDEADMHTTNEGEDNAENGGGSGSDSEGKSDDRERHQLESLVERMNRFIEASSGLEGVEIDDAPLNIPTSSVRGGTRATTMANPYLPDNEYFEIETDNMIDALKKALLLDPQQQQQQQQQQQHRQQSYSDLSSSEDDDVLGGTTGEYDDDDDDSIQAENEILCELHDAVEKRKEDTRRVRMELGFESDPDNRTGQGAERVGLDVLLNDDMRGDGGLGSIDDDLESTIREIHKSLVLDDNGPDSDDESDDIDDSKSDGKLAEKIEAELAEHPALRQSFYRSSSERRGKDEKKIKEGGTDAVYQRSREGDRANDENGELSPLDVDYNMVKSLIDSVIAEEGMPGPASNLIKALGIDLDDLSMGG